MNRKDFMVDRDLLADARVIEFGAYRLASGARKFELKQEICKSFSTDESEAWIEPSDYETYLKACRKAIAQIADVSEPEMIQRLTATLFDMLQDESGSTKDRVSVVSELVRLFGLDRYKGGTDSASRIRELVNANKQIRPPDEA